MKSATTFVREQRATVPSNGAPKPKPSRIKSRLRQVKPTTGDWQASGLAVVQDEVTIAVADIRRIPPEVAQVNIRMMAAAKRYHELIEDLARATVGKTDFDDLISRAKEAIGGT